MNPNIVQCYHIYTLQRGVKAISQVLWSIFTGKFVHFG